LLYYYIHNTLDVEILIMIYISHCAVKAATAITSPTQNRKPRIPQRSCSILSTVSAVFN